MKKIILSVLLILLLGQSTWASGLNDPLYMTYQYYILKSIGYSDTYDGTGVKIAIVDSGINKDHEEIKTKNVTYEMNLVGEKIEDVTDKMGHGTFIAGLIGAQTNNEVGIVGLTPNVEMISLKCFDDNLSTDIETVIKCIEQAIELKVDVLNLSLTTPIYSEELKEVIDRAIEKKIIVIASSGNDMSEKNYYPASFKGVISVNSIHVDPVGLVVSPSSISNPNEEVTVSAPGDNLISISHKDLSGYKQRDGSSYATAYVSALAIMAKQHTPTINATSFENLLKETSTDYGSFGRDPIYGYGLINVEEALNNIDILGLEIRTNDSKFE